MKALAAWPNFYVIATIVHFLAVLTLATTILSVPWEAIHAATLLCSAGGRTRVACATVRHNENASTNLCPAALRSMEH